eukprot:CAMPEP_0177202986 /NCGR_PEP_ID=MMETSP0367-20130122/27575_1 /TAXON_ID=447022 ORGANISM="Scrippsiella hangoei-like, Strain SHHI-4" /NCGR_SAMPLE_ID=MMETSP0367 /ASSEMBLY_ACC=CAM_ASM_000362 /LENGTH=443 /DNA_ID=CAMNT_0018651589 /DNA_START=55 /DNA_END=1382 /DNA_ORIENTATION=+
MALPPSSSPPLDVEPDGGEEGDDGSFVRKLLAAWAWFCAQMTLLLQRQLRPIWQSAQQRWQGSSSWRERYWERFTTEGFRSSSRRFFTAAREKLMRYRRTSLSAFLCFLLLVGHFAPFFPSDRTGGASLPSSSQLSQAELVRIRALENAKPGVVHIIGEAASSDQGGGTGWVYSDRGHVYIVTSVRAVDTTRHGELHVRLADQTVVPARLVGLDRSSDLAVVEVNLDRTSLKGSERPRPLRLGSSASLRVGQDVYIIGNPFGFDHTLTRGMISAVGRTLAAEGAARPVSGALEIDARVHLGNSGGPLLDSSGRVVGMATAASSQKGGGGLGLAMPVDVVAQRVESILERGHVNRPELGLGLGPDGLAERLGCAGSGAVIVEVPKGSPADEAGVRVGDVVVAVGGRRVRGAEEVLAALEDQRGPGGRGEATTARLAVRRPVDPA